MKTNTDITKYIIQRISAEDTYPIRQPVLRASKPIEDCVFNGDTWDSTFHLGLYFKSALIGVASFIKNKHSDFQEENQYQLRGMAILEAHQKKGLGKLILQAGEEKLINLNSNRLWFNAREVAVEFYKNHGYQIQGNSFYIPDVGIHFLMTKQISTKLSH